MGQLIVTLLIIVFAIAMSLKQQLDKAAKEEQRRKGGPEEGLPEHVRQAMRQALEPTSVESEAEPEVMVVRERTRRPEVVVQRARQQARAERRPRRAEPLRGGPKARAIESRSPQRPKSAEREWGKRETVRQVRLPRYQSPIVTAIVMHEILMPPVSLKKTQQVDVLDRIV